MLSLILENNCRKDLRKAKKRGKDLNLFWSVVKILQQDKQLPTKNRPHRLSGNWNGFSECHIEPGWLMIYLINEDKELILVRTGTHADLFR